MRIFSTGIGRSSPGRRKLKELALGAKEGLSGTLSKHWKYSYLRWSLCGWYRALLPWRCTRAQWMMSEGHSSRKLRMSHFIQWESVLSLAQESARRTSKFPAAILFFFFFFLLRGTIRVWRQFKKENEVWVGKGKSYLWNYFTNLNLWTECWDFLTGPHLKSLDLGKIKCSISRLLTLRVGCSF